jgi:hypothetical protein
MSCIRLTVVTTGAHAQQSALLASSGQLIVVTTSGWNSGEATLQRFARSAHKPWG